MRGGRLESGSFSPRGCSATAFANPEVGPFKKPRLEPAAQAQGRLGSNGLAERRGGGLPSPFPQLPRPRSSHIKGCKKPAPGAGPSLSVFVDFLYTYRRGKNVHRERAYDGAVPPLPPRDAGDSSLASGGARLIYIFRGGGRAAAPSPGQCVN